MVRCGEGSQAGDETNPRGRHLGGHCWPGVARLDGPCLPGPGLLEPRPQGEHCWRSEGRPGLCAPTPARLSREDSWPGTARTAVHSFAHEVAWSGAGCSRVPVGHRSRDPPWHGLGEPGFGGVAPDPERGVRHHRVSAGQAAVQEPPSVHGNHVGTCRVPLPKPLGTWGVQSGHGGSPLGPVSALSQHDPFLCPPTTPSLHAMSTRPTPPRPTRSDL